MNIVKVNAIGDNCPIPVVKAKKAIESLTGAAIVEINVDNEIAVQNVTKMVNQKNLESTCEKLGEKNYLIKVKCGEVVESQAEEEVVTTVEKEEKIVVVLSSDKMGEGDDELGKVLIKGFIYAITQLDKLPKSVLLYNGGVKLSTEGSDSIPSNNSTSMPASFKYVTALSKKPNRFMLPPPTQTIAFFPSNVLSASNDPFP